LSAIPLNTILGGVPVSVATPPMLAEKATQSENVLANWRNSLSSDWIGPSHLQNSTEQTNNSTKLE